MLSLNITVYIVEYFICILCIILTDSTNPGHCFIGKDGNNRNIQTTEVSVGGRRI